MSHWIEITSQLIPWNSIVRGSGLAAYLLLFVSVAGGLMLSVQWISARSRPAFLSYHRLFSLASLIMTAIHVLAFVVAKKQILSWQDVLVPFWTAHYKMEIAVGILAAYIILLLAVTSTRAVMRSLRFDNWRLVHLLAFAGYWLALYHSVALAKSSNALFQSLLYPATVSLVTALILLRLWKAAGRLRAAHEHSAG